MLRLESPFYHSTSDAKYFRDTQCIVCAFDCVRGTSHVVNCVRGALQPIWLAVQGGYWLLIMSRGPDYQNCPSTGCVCLLNGIAHWRRRWRKISIEPGYTLASLGISCIYHHYSSRTVGNQILLLQVCKGHVLGFIYHSRTLTVASAVHFCLQSTDSALCYNKSLC